MVYLKAHGEKLSDLCAGKNKSEVSWIYCFMLLAPKNYIDYLLRQCCRHWFGMDTKSDRLEWCDKLNEALANVRQWYSDAARPIPAKRMEI